MSEKPWTTLAESVERIRAMAVEANALYEAMGDELERIDTSTHDQRSVLVGGVVFTERDVERLMESPPDEAALTEIAERLSALLPPREPEGKP